MEEKLQFTPFTKILFELLGELKPVQIFDYEGMDIRDISEFELEGEKCTAQCYKADKLEKICVSSLNFFGQMVADVIIITPGREYDIPYFVVDWDESEEHIFFIADLLPSDDPGRNIDYLDNYLFNPLDELYQNYSEMPGLKNSVFHWVRAIHSPYIITGTIKKEPKKNMDLLLDCAKDYLKAWIELWKNAKPQDPNSDYMKLIYQRRANIRKFYRENDPGAGPLTKFLGPDQAERLLAVIEP
jgi:hypothetical protein